MSLVMAEFLEILLCCILQSSTPITGTAHSVAVHLIRACKVRISVNKLDLWGSYILSTQSAWSVESKYELIVDFAE